MLYMDSSALVKRYVEEEESPAVVARIESAPILDLRLGFQAGDPRDVMKTRDGEGTTEQAD